MSKPETLRALTERYVQWADEYYRHEADANGFRRPTREINNITDAIRWLEPYLDKPLAWCAKHGADMLLACIDAMLEREKPPTREYVNATIKRIRRMFRWAAEPLRRWVPPSAITAMELVPLLKRGRTAAREAPKKQPVDSQVFTATLAAIAEEGYNPARSAAMKMLSIMLEIQWHTGMRPGELVRMRRSELSVEQPQLSLFHAAPGSFWGVQLMIYRPFVHKTRHHGIDRNIFLGPEAQRLVQDWLITLPKQSDALFNYTTNSYGNALRKIAQRRGLPPIAPNTIRHAFATRMRAASGIDVVQVLMGHRHRATTEIYARPDAAAAIDAIWRFG